MKDSLATYLQDHLAGSVHAKELVEHIRDQHVGEPLGDFAAGLLGEIEADRDVLQTLAKKIGAGTNTFKEASAWLSEKLGRIKMGREAGNDLGTFEALEFLELGINGKMVLWLALAAVAPGDSRLQDLDYDGLVSRAKSQISQVEAHRLRAAIAALRP